jgi:hypothetical protein
MVQKNVPIMVILFHGTFEKGQRLYGQSGPAKSQ